MSFKNLPDSYWKEKLTAEQFKVCRRGGTELPFSGEYTDYKVEGTYKCCACGSELFRSDTKFDSGSGWPSFYDVIDRARVELKEDRSLAMTRIEVCCTGCGSHLGHVFDDGPEPTGKRYCINSICLTHSPGRQAD